MGFLSSIAAARKIAKMKAGSRESISIADITNLIINLPDAKKNLPQNQFDAVYSLYKALQKCRTNMSMDLMGYYEQAVIVIGIFNEIAPYEKYSGMEKTESLFFMDGINSLLHDLKPRSKELLNQLKANNPDLKQYFCESEADIEILLTELFNRQRTPEDDRYIDYFMQSCRYLKREHAITFCGILVANYFYGKEKALDLMDRLFMKWINAETIDDLKKPTNETLYDPQNKIAFFCGALVPYGIVTKEESNQLATKYTDLWAQHTLALRKINCDAGPQHL